MEVLNINIENSGKQRARKGADEVLVERMLCLVKDYANSADDIPLAKINELKRKIMDLTPKKAPDSTPSWEKTNMGFLINKEQLEKIRRLKGRGSWAEAMRKIIDFYPDDYRIK